MASTIPTVPGEDTRQIVDTLYEKSQEPSRNPGLAKLFTQDDLLSLGITQDLTVLTECINKLTADGLFKMMMKDGAVCWKVVSKEDAARYKNLNTEEAIVYGYIESVGREGIWTKTIRSKSNLHEAVFARCLKQLETRGLIKATTNAKFPTRKFYLLGYLQPLEEISGGPFYTDGSIDDEFVRVLCIWVHKHVHDRSWLYKKVSQKRRSARTDEQAASHFLPFPSGYLDYPRLRDITDSLNQAGLSSVVLKETEVQQILDLLCWDGRLERVTNGQGYRSIPKSGDGEDAGHNIGRENGLLETPCGRCPVLDLCEEDGPVNAKTCNYFPDWLNV